METYLPRRDKQNRLKTTCLWYGVVERVKPPYIRLGGLSRRGAGFTIADYMKSSRGRRFLTTISLVKQEQLQLQLAVCDIILALVNLLQQYELYMLITMNKTYFNKVVRSASVYSASLMNSSLAQLCKPTAVTVPNSRLRDTSEK